jgi:diguanylate cyclase (GGDEF)-like protein/PAS domain S-box-containing protein
MTARRSTLQFSLHVWLAVCLFIALAITFVSYVHLEKAVDRANDLRHQSLLLANELRQSSDDLTRMARSYVATGTSVYKQYYQDIIDIRDGKLARPARYPHIYWELLLIDKVPAEEHKQPAISLLDLMLKSEFTQHEIQLLEEAKAASDNLTSTERKAMDLVDKSTPDQLSENRLAASNLLYGKEYDAGKAAVMQPINHFFSAMNKRTQDAVTQAEYKAAIMRYTLVSFSLCLIFVMWLMSRVLRNILGGTVNEVYKQITRIGKGDFTSPIIVEKKYRNSVLGWLSQTQRNLQQIREERLQVENAKQESDARYQKLFDSCPIGINIFSPDPEEFLIDGNPALLNLFGYSIEELRQLRPGNMVAQMEQEHVKPALVSIDSGENYFREWQLRRKDGSSFPAEVIATKLTDGTMMSIVIDITQRKRAEEQLRSSEENLSITLQSIGDAVIATDAEGLITRMNATAERLTAWPLQVARGRPLKDVFNIINAKTRERVLHPVELVIQHGQVVGLANDTTLIARDGTEYHISDSAAPIRDASGGIVGIVLVFSDVSERYKAIEDLRSADERFRRTFKLIPHSVTIQNKAGVLLDCSDEFCRSTGYSREEIVGHDIQDLNLWVEPEKRFAMREELFRNGQVDDFEFQLRRRDGEIRNIEFSARYLTNEQEPMLLAVAHDITKRKHAEALLHQNERFIATLAHNMPGMVSHWTKDLRCNFANKEYLNWFGKTAEEVYQSTPQQIIGEEAFKLNEPFMRAALEGKAQSFERIIPRSDGTSVYVWTQYIPDISEGKVEGMFVVVLDISERKLAELALQESVLHTQAILDNMFDGVITINTRGVIQSFNKAASTIFGYGQDEVLGLNVTMLMPAHFKHQHESYLQHHNDSLDSEVLNTLREVEGKRRNGEIFPMSLSISKILRAGTVTFVGLVRDISQQRHDEEEIYRLAFYDPLTNLPNRRLLFDRLQQAILTSCRTDQHGALMFLDLDHFKQLNDSLGHDVGDILLQQVAVRLQTCLREGDSVARMGGDEFVMLIEALSIYPNEAASQAEGIAHKILAALAEPYSLREHTYVITPSIGIVVFLHQQDNLDELLKKADVAMYQAKTAGRNNARFFDPTMQAAVSVRITLEKNMRIALERKEFLLHYQLQVDSKGTPTGVEALVRWNHGEHGMISPAAFIPLAEETGMILPLGQWVLETACAQLVSWAKKPATANWTMAVNVSVSQFAQLDFVAHVKKALKKTGANPRLLKLELTESMLVKDVEDVIVKMVEIKALGVTFSLDDFGTGYSSLSYLKRLPLDQLKIDQSFVRDLLTDPNDAAIARTIVALGHSLSLKVIAEGVETREQRDALAQMGCDTYQGYYFARPVPIENILETIKKIPT